MIYRLLSIAFMLPLLASPARGDNALDLITDRAAMTLATGDIDELKTNVDRLAQIMSPQLNQKPSAFFDTIAVQLGIQGRKKNSVLAVSHHPGQPDRGWFDRFVLTVQYADLDEIAAGFGYKKGEFPANKMVEVKIGKGLGQWRYARDGYLHISDSKEALTSALAGKPVTFDPALVKQMGKAGLVFHASAEGMKSGNADFFTRLVSGNAQPSSGEREKAIEKALAAAMPDVEHALLWIRFDDSMRLSLAPVYKKGSKPAKKLFDLFRRGARRPTFNALPVGDVVAAHAAVGSDGWNAAALNLIFRYLGSGMVPREWLGPNWSQFVDVFTELSRHLDGARLALYHVEPQHGMFSLVGILDTEDGAKFLSEVRLLARIGHFKGLKLEDPVERQASVKLIKQLVEDLGSEQFRVRESASVKLQLIGEPAAEHLRAAAKDADLERVRRAERILEAVARDIKARREALLKPDQLLQYKPSFVFLDKQEKIAGFDVFQVGVVFPGRKDPGRSKLLNHYLGPDWQRIRIAVHGKQVVVLAGSDVKLLEQALVNLKEGKPGLEGLAAFKNSALPRAQTRFQLSVRKLADLATGADLKKPRRGKPADDMTAVVFQVGDNHLQIDFRAPIDDFKAIRELEPVLRGLR